MRQAPVAVSQSRTVRSLLALAKLRPSRANSAAFTVAMSPINVADQRREPGADRRVPQSTVRSQPCSGVAARPAPEDTGCPLMSRPPTAASATTVAPAPTTLLHAAARLDREPIPSRPEPGSAVVGRRGWVDACWPT